LIAIAWVAFAGCNTVMAIVKEPKA